MKCFLCNYCKCYGLSFDPIKSQLHLACIMITPFTIPPAKFTKKCKLENLKRRRSKISDKYLLCPLQIASPGLPMKYSYCPTREEHQFQQTISHELYFYDLNRACLFGCLLHLSSLGPAYTQIAIQFRARCCCRFFPPVFTKRESTKATMT